MSAHPGIPDSVPAIPPVASQPVAAPSTWPARPEHPRRILVADDESLAAASVVLCLRQLGYTALGPARDGEHAVELTFSARPDLALLDARMATDMDGIDAARAVFGEWLVPVVMVSAYADRPQVAGASEAGVFGYLLKPVTREQLRPAIEIAWARFNQYMAREIEAEDLRRRLEERDDIDRAKWVLVERAGVDEGEAMRMMRRKAKGSGRPIAEIAREVLEGL